jgi:quercetin dioxygenase-like cupin family protein
MTNENFRIPQLADELHLPESGRQSIVLTDNANIKVVLFAFVAGDGLAEHVAPIPAIIQIIVEMTGDHSTNDENRQIEKVQLMAMNHPATIRKSNEGRRIGIVGDVYRFLATGDDTDSRYATFEAIAPPGSGPPPHIQSREEESFLVLEGEMTFQLSEERIVAGEGTFLNMPMGSLHCFKNESDKTARLLISLVPAGLERMFLEVGQSLEDDATSAPPPSQAEIEKLLEAAPRYGVEIIAR